MASLYNIPQNFYFMGLDKFRPEDFKAAGFSQKTFNRIQQIAIQEKAHVTFLATALGAGAVDVCDYNFEAAFSSVGAFIATSQILESVGTAAYLGEFAAGHYVCLLVASGSTGGMTCAHTKVESLTDRDVRLLRSCPRRFGQGLPRRCRLNLDH